MDVVQTLKDIDEHLTQMLIKSSESELQDYILEALQHAGTEPGRGAKLRTVYLLERLAELVADLVQDQVNVRRNQDGFMRWIDRGLSAAAYLTDPDTQGKWLASFDQTIIQVDVPDAKDPETIKQRHQEARELNDRWSGALHDLRAHTGPKPKVSEPRRGGGSGPLIVLPS